MAMLSEPLASMHVTSGFGPRGPVTLPDGRVRPAGDHNGVDLRADVGDVVVSPIDGTVEKLTFSPSGAMQLFIRGTGDDSRWRVALVHLSDILEPPGAAVVRHQPVALSGDSGGVEPHLHLEVRDRGRLVDPVPLLFGDGGGAGAVVLAMLAIWGLS